MILAAVPASRCDAQWFCATQSSEEAVPAVDCLVHDALGRLVAVLEDGVQTSGFHRRSFDGGTLPNGMYVYRLVARGQSVSRRMYLIR